MTGRQSELESLILNDTIPQKQVIIQVKNTFCAQKLLLKSYVNSHLNFSIKKWE